jgi:hypothetical protein
MGIAVAAPGMTTGSRGVRRRCVNLEPLALSMTALSAVMATMRPSATNQAKPRRRRPVDSTAPLQPRSP